MWVGWRPRSRRNVASWSDFFFYRCDIVQGNHGVKRQPISFTVRPFTQIKMKADAELRVLSGVKSGGLGSRPSRHQACARDNQPCSCASIMPWLIAAIWPKSSALTIRYFSLCISYSPKSFRTLAKTVSALKYSWAIARAARPCRS